jgi:hypothetical protein
MGFTSAMASMPGIHVIDVDDVIKSGDPESFPALSVKQPHGTFSKGMFGDLEDFEEEEGLVVSDLGARIPFSFSANPFPSEYRIPTSEYEARIKEMEAAGSDIMARSLAGTNGKEFLCKDQNGTNFCWANAPAHCFEIARLYSNDELIYFSPGSVAGPVNGFSNTGGWGGAAVNRMVSDGISPADIYPVNQVRKPSNFADAMQVAATYKVLEWWELDTLQDVVSCLLRGWPVAVGLNWWSHEVSYTNALWIDGTLAIGFRNSWGMSYGSKGFSILKGSRMNPSDAVTPRVASPAPRKVA